MEENRLVRETGMDRAFTWFNYLFIGLVTVSVLYPLIYVISASFSSPEALMSGKVWLLPVEFGLEGYKAVFRNSEVWIGFGNSLFYMAAGTAVNVVLTVAAAYPLSRKDLRGRGVVTLLFAFTMIFSGGMIPTYLLVRDLGLLDSRLAMIVPTAINVFNVFVAMAFFRQNIPDELLDSAKIDGSSNFRFLISIVLPNSSAVIAVVALFYAVDHWNSFFEALLYLSDENKYPLQIFLREILLMNNTDMMDMDLVAEQKRMYMSELLKYSLIITATLPLMILYPFIQRYFVKGVMIGSLKG